MRTEHIVRAVLAHPDREDAILDEFVANVAFVADDSPSAEHLEDVRQLILPVPKSAGYVRPWGPTANVVHRRWVGDIIVCYGLSGSKTLRFVLEPDIDRWRRYRPAGTIEHRLNTIERSEWTAPEKSERSFHSTTRNAFSTIALNSFGGR